LAGMSDHLMSLDLAPNWVMLLVCHYFFLFFPFFLISHLKCTDCSDSDSIISMFGSLLFLSLLIFCFDSSEPLLTHFLLLLFLIPSKIWKIWQDCTNIILIILIIIFNCETKEDYSRKNWNLSHFFAPNGKTHLLVSTSIINNPSVKFIGHLMEILFQKFQTFQS